MTEEQQIIFEMYSQACYTKTGYDNMWISAYEQAEEYLIQNNIIKPDQCVRR
jgi:hypothetical protein